MTEGYILENSEMVSGYLEKAIDALGEDGSGWAARDTLILITLKAILKQNVFIIEALSKQQQGG